jgi:hypothetical protein
VESDIFEFSKRNKSSRCCIFCSCLLTSLVFLCRKQDGWQEEEQDRDLELAEGFLESPPAMEDDSSPARTQVVSQGRLVNSSCATTAVVVEDCGEMPVMETLDYMDFLCNATDAESVDLAIVRFYRQHRSRMRKQAGQRKREDRVRRARLRKWQRMRCASACMRGPLRACLAYCKQSVWWDLAKGSKSQLLNDAWPFDPQQV